MDNIFVIVLESVLVLLGIGVIGFWLTRRNILPENVLGFYSTLAIDITLLFLLQAAVPPVTGVPIFAKCAVHRKSITT